MLKRKRKLFTLGLTVFMSVTILCSNITQASGISSVPDVETESYVAEETADETESSSSEDIQEESCETSSESEEGEKEAASDIVEESSEETAEEVSENSEEISSENVEINDNSESTTEEESTEQNINVEMEENTEESSEMSTEENSEITTEEGIEIEIEDSSELPSEIIAEETAVDEQTEVFIMPTESVWTSENFEVKHSIINYWEGGYQGEVVITNIGDTTIEDWNLMFEMNTDIYQIWNASIDSNENGLYIIKNDNWNANIGAGQSRSFGYLASYENTVVLPESYGISGSEKELAGDSYEITYEVTDMWEDGYVGNITITNLSDKELRNWKLSFDLGDEICDIWNATIHSNENGQYVLHHAEHNAVISAGGSVTIGFRVQDDELQMYPENYAVKVIVHSEIKTEYKDDVIGIAYFEELKAEDYRIADDGIQYVANQLNLVGKDGVTFDQIADLGTAYEFEIVGYIEFTNDYQVKFVNDKTYEELNELMAEIGQNELILEANLNLVSTLESDNELDIPNDTEWSNEVLWQGKLQDINWGMRAINVVGAWQYEEYMTTVKVGVLDNMFDKSHDDLKFVEAWNNWTPEQAEENWDDHGTHVAGIMAAEYNNNMGISGIAVNKELYGYAWIPNKDEIAGEIKSTSMEYKYAFALLIGNGVRVINISQSTGRTACFAASQGNENARTYIKTNANVMDSFLQRLIARRYDFVLVVSAGNVNNISYIKDDTQIYGYREFDSEKDNISDKEVGNAEAVYNNFLLRAYKSRDRIIAVGALGWNGMATFSYMNYSCIGDRVDIVAPGNNIYSTVSGNRYQNKYIDEEGIERMWGGTSSAAPHVSGVVALAYSLNPNLSGPQVKQLIIEQCSGITVKDTNGKEYACVNAEKVVVKALEISGNTPIIGQNTGFVMGTVRSIMHLKPIIAANISAYKYSTHSGNVSIGEPEDYQYVTKTNKEGEFSLELDPGMYRIIVSDILHKPLIIDNIEVRDNEVVYVEKVMFIENSIDDCVEARGYVINALDGSAMKDVNIAVRDGWNNYSGDIITDNIVTDENGIYSVELFSGYYTLELKKDGYINSYVNIIVYLGMEEGIAVISPEMEDNEVRVVLTWGSMPKDMDAHLLLCSDGQELQHIYHNNKSFFDCYNKKYYKLDIDDTMQYGPETITFYTDNSSFDEYKYYVINFSGGEVGNELSYSGARVTIYYDNQESKTLNVPVNQVGRKWNVFSIIDGKLVIENTIQ